MGISIWVTRMDTKHYNFDPRILLAIWGMSIAQQHNHPFQLSYQFQIGKRKLFYH